MKITATVCEYNPFHNGHKYLTEKARENGATHFVGIMGGDFLQRGECAVIDKFHRAKAAVLGGVDLVLELPCIYALASAERFAYGAVAVLDSCGCIDELCFGAECGDTEQLRQIADITARENVLDKVREYQSLGYSHPRAMQTAVCELVSDGITADVLNSPNNTLGIEYVRALTQLNSRIVPYAVQRVGAKHDSAKTFGKFASASLVREKIMCSDMSYEHFIPKEVCDIINMCRADGVCPANVGNNERGMLSVLRKLTANDIANIPDVSEGLEHRIYNAVHTENTVTGIIEKVKCKRYTYARISRVLMCAYLGITKELAAAEPQYIRVLAFNDRGTQILREMKSRARLPLVMSPARDKAKLDDTGRELLELELRASDLYGLFTPKIMECGRDYRNVGIKIG